MDLYAENILDHYRDPRNKVQNAKCKVQSGITHSEKNISCGDEITVALDIENSVITSIKWTGTGWAISQAGMSIFAEEFEGKTSEEIMKLKKDDIYELLGVPIGPRRFKCALLCLHTIKNAIRKHEGQEPQMWLETVEIGEE